MPRHVRPTCSVNFNWTTKALERLFRLIIKNISRYRVLFEKGKVARVQKWKLLRKLFVKVLNRSSSNRSWAEEVVANGLLKKDPDHGLEPTSKWDGTFRNPLDRKFLTLREKYEEHKLKLAPYTSFEDVPEELRALLKRLSPWHFHFERILRVAPPVPPARLQTGDQRRSPSKSVDRAAALALDQKIQQIEASPEPSQPADTLFPEDGHAADRITVDVDDPQPLIETKPSLPTTKDKKKNRKKRAKSTRRDTTSIEPSMPTSTPVSIDLTLIDDDDDPREPSQEPKHEETFSEHKLDPALADLSLGLVVDVGEAVLHVQQDQWAEKALSEYDDREDVNETGEGVAMTGESKGAETGTLDAATGMNRKVRRFMSLARSSSPFDDIAFRSFDLTDQPSPPPTPRSFDQPPANPPTTVKQKDRSTVVRGWTVAIPSSPSQPSPLRLSSPSSEAASTSSVIPLTRGSPSEPKTAEEIDELEEDAEGREYTGNVGNEEVVMKEEREELECPSVSKKPSTKPRHKNKHAGGQREAAVASKPCEQTTPPSPSRTIGMVVPAVDNVVISSTTLHVPVDDDDTLGDMVVSLPSPEPSSSRTDQLLRVDSPRRRPLSPVIELPKLRPIDRRSYIPFTRSNHEPARHASGYAQPASKDPLPVAAVQHSPSSPSGTEPTTDSADASSNLGEITGEHPDLNDAAISPSEEHRPVVEGAHRDKPAAEGGMVIDPSHSPDLAVADVPPCIKKPRHKRRAENGSVELPPPKRRVSEPEIKSEQVVEVTSEQKLQRARSDVFLASWFQKPVSLDPSSAKFQNRVKKERCCLFVHGLMPQVSVSESKVLSTCKVLVDPELEKSGSWGKRATQARKLIILAGAEIVTDQPALLEGSRSFDRIILCLDADVSVDKIKREQGRPVRVKRMSVLEILRWLDKKIRETASGTPVQPGANGLSNSPSPGGAGRRPHRKVTFAPIPEERFYANTAPSSGDRSTPSSLPPSVRAPFSSSLNGSVSGRALQANRGFAQRPPAERIATLIRWGRSTSRPHDCDLGIHMEHDRQEQNGHGAEYLDRLRLEWLQTGYEELQDWIGQTTALQASQVMRWNDLKRTPTSVHGSSPLGRVIIRAGGGVAKRPKSWRNGKTLIVPTHFAKTLHKRLEDEYQARVMTELEFMLRLDGIYRDQSLIPEEIEQEMARQSTLSARGRHKV